jgi:midasin (ATPase involved in ribosome maturation)
MFSLNDFTKFIKFREQTKEIFDYDIILTMLLIHKFQFKKDINKLISELHYSNEDFWPIFNYEHQKINEDEYESYFYISPYGSKKMLQKQIKSKINIQTFSEIRKQIKSLTLIQRLGLIFLLLSVNSNIPVIIQGETGSGKSYLIRLFAKLCGENLEVIELNNDSGIQILSGQIIPKSDLTNDEITSLQSIFKKINDIKDINNILNDIEIENPENWKPSKFNIILEKIKKFLKKFKKT